MVPWGVVRRLARSRTWWASATASATPTRSWPRRWACRRTTSRSAPPGSTTSASCTRSATARTGEDLYPRLREIVDADPEGLGRRVRVEIFKRFGYFPTESSEHSSEYVPWFLHHDDEVERYRIRSTTTSAAVRARTSPSTKRSSAALDAGEDARARAERASSRREIIHSIETGTPREVYGNVPQRRPDRRPARGRAASRCPAWSTGTACSRRGSARCPPQSLALNRTFVNVVELTVRAALEGSRDLVYQAALLDPQHRGDAHRSTRSSRMVDDLIEATAS